MVDIALSRDSYIYKTGARYIFDNTLSMINYALSAFITDRYHLEHPEVSEWEELKGVRIDLKRRVISFFYGEYEEAVTNSYGLVGETKNELLLHGISIALKGDMEYDPDEEQDSSWCFIIR